MDTENTQPTYSPQALFKAVPAPEASLSNVHKALQSLSDMDRYVFACFVAHCQNTNCKMNDHVVKSIFPCFPLLCSRAGQVTPAVRSLTLQAIELNNGHACVKSNEAIELMQHSLSSRI